MVEANRVLIFYRNDREDAASKNPFHRAVCEPGLRVRLHHDLAAFGELVNGKITDFAAGENGRFRLYAVMNCMFAIVARLICEILV